MRMENVDARGNVAESWAEFDPEAKIHVSFQRRPNAENPAASRTKFGRNIESVSFSGVTNAPGYDDLGRVVSSTDGRGNATTFLYNAQGQRVCAIDAATNATWSAFDDYGRLASV
jgi:YD repeat-containing protein